MEDTAKTDSTVIEICRFIEERKGLDTVAIYIGGQSNFTDYFVITTVSSFTHLRGIYRDLRDFLSDNDAAPLHRQKFLQENDWVLIDCGNIVVHLMSRETREFYDLERLWHQGKMLYHSSKSS